MTREIIVYTQDNCQPCKATLRLLDKQGTVYTEARLEDFPQVREYALEQGWTSAPVVLVYDKIKTVILAGWSGYRPDKIKAVNREEQ